MHHPTKCGGEGIRHTSPRPTPLANVRPRDLRRVVPADEIRPPLTILTYKIERLQCLRCLRLPGCLSNTCRNNR